MESTGADRRGQEHGLRDFTSEKTNYKELSVNRKNGVYVNRTLNLRKIKYIGFDMDHTLVRYNTRIRWQPREPRPHTEKQEEKSVIPSTETEILIRAGQAVHHNEVEEAAALLGDYSSVEVVPRRDEVSCKNQHYKVTYKDFKSVLLRGDVFGSQC